MKTGVSRQLWDMIANTVRVTGPTDFKLTFLERKFIELSENMQGVPKKRPTFSRRNENKPNSIKHYQIPLNY